MPKFPVDAPLARVLRALESLGFRVVREREHTICAQAGSSRDDFLRAYEES